VSHTTVCFAAKGASVHHGQKTGGSRRQERMQHPIVQEPVGMVGKYVQGDTVSLTIHKTRIKPESIEIGIIQERLVITQ